MDHVFYNVCTGIMNGVVKPVTEFHNYIVEDTGDPRTDDWFLVKSPWPLLMILSAYVYVSVKAGPMFMKDRKPYTLQYTLIVYNLIQVLFSIFLLHEGLHGGWATGYKFSCQPVERDTSPRAMRMANAVWWYYMAKLSELLDTIFFVLRKKNNQISFLHVYHHFMMPICAWVGVKYVPGGHGTLLGLINAFVHIWMYSYYMIASMGPKYQKYLWWKRHLTEIQMVQFCLVFLHEFQLLLRKCDYPKILAFLLVVETAFFFYLFAKFYIRTYVRTKKPLPTENNNVSNGKLKGH